MNETLEFDGERYISSKRAAQLFGYTKDYVGQLCRGKKIESRLVGRTWYVSENALRAHKLAVHHALHQPMHERQTKGLLPVEASEVVKVRATEFEARTLGQVHPTEVLARAARPVPVTAVTHEQRVPRSTKGLSALTQLDVSYDPEQPLYFEDDRPVNPEPVRVIRFENVPIVAPEATARVRAVQTLTLPRTHVRPDPTQRQSAARSDGIAPIRRSGVPQRPVQDFRRVAPTQSGVPQNGKPATTYARKQTTFSKTIPVVLGVLVGLSAVVGYLLFGVR